MAKKLWGGRFSKKTDPLVEEFTKSIDYDYKLARYDVVGSQIHIAILEKNGFLTPEEVKELKKVLSDIYEKIKNGAFIFNKNSEDIHTNIQNEIEKRVGGLALKLHTARSRNDQVLFDLKLFCKVELLKVVGLCTELKQALLVVSAGNTKTFIPGYTHLQHAQLVCLSDYMHSYVEMLERDQQRLVRTRDCIKLSLGAAAFAGTPIKAEIYHSAVSEFIIKNKEFADQFNVTQDITVPQSIDTVSDRDFVIETLSVLAILGMHLSRLAEDLIIWLTKEFGFVELDDAFATGSSLMPQKKNPDVLELIRGYTGTLYGNLVSALTMMKGLPLTYNRDMQLDKPPLFSSFEIIEKELKVLPGLIETLKWKKDVIKKRVDEDETLYATDFVYYLIGKGIPFKEAHDIIGKLVKFSIDENVKIKEMPDGTLKKFSDKLKHNEIIKLMDPEVSVKSRISVDRERKA